MPRPSVSTSGQSASLRGAASTKSSAERSGPNSDFRAVAPSRSYGAPSERMATTDSGTHAHHGIHYIEIAVTDVSRAKRFDGAAFGWSFNDYGPDYAGIQGAGKEVGSLRKGDSVRGGGPLVVLYSL